MAEAQDLAALIGSRICHDLISPIGAISNGVELLAMDGSAQGPEVALIAESAAHANARLRFFRIAFGQASADQRIGRGEVQSILAELYRGGRLQVAVEAPSDLARIEARMLFLGILCLETALPYGGRIAAERTEAGWVLVAQGARLRADPALWQALSDPAAVTSFTPAQVQFPLLAADMARAGRPAQVALAEAQVRLAF
jgi:histidine phosphotransferase ChpT